MWHQPRGNQPAVQHCSIKAAASGLVTAVICFQGHCTCGFAPRASCSPEFINDYAQKNDHGVPTSTEACGTKLVFGCCCPNMKQLRRQMEQGYRHTVRTMLVASNESRVESAFAAALCRMHDCNTSVGVHLARCQTASGLTCHTAMTHILGPGSAC